MRDSILAPMGVVWLVLARLDLSSLVPNTFVSRLVSHHFVSAKCKGVVDNFPFNPFHWQVVVHVLLLEDTPEQFLFKIYTKEKIVALLYPVWWRVGKLSSCALALLNFSPC